MASGDAVQQIKDKLTIEEVVAPYVELHRAGKNLKGKSPFTAEKTPSFYVSPDRGMYYCFSSNQGGDMFTFIETIEGVDFKGALKILAEKAGVELVPEDPQKRTEREQKYAALEAATNWYEGQLGEAHAHLATQYLTARGVTDKTRQLWRIGFAPDAWRALKSELEDRNFSSSIIRDVGLIKGDPGKEPYDVFRNRIVFPIADPSGRVIAFSGRTLLDDPETPKYVNSPETELFNKSEALFGYDKAKNGIRKYNFSLIVEGQFDVVLAHQAGYNNAVAVSGTALTQAHVTLLGRLSDRVVLALDADRAGLAALKKAASLMLRRGMDVKVARLPEGKDPADIIKEEPERFKKIIGQSVHVVEHLLDVLVATSRDDRALGVAVRQEVLPLILLIPSAIEHDFFLKLTTTKTTIGLEALRLELNRLIEAGAHEAESQSDATTDVTQTPVTTTDPVSDRQRKYHSYRALVILLPELVDCVDESKLRQWFEDQTGDRFATAKEQISLEDEVTISDDFRRQNNELSVKETKSRVVEILSQFMTLHIAQAIDRCKAEPELGEETWARIYALRKQQTELSTTTVDIFSETTTG